MSAVKYVEMIRPFLYFFVESCTYIILNPEEYVIFFKVNLVSYDHLKLSTENQRLRKGVSERH